MSKTTAEVLKKAKHLLETHGWCKGRYRNADGRFCAYGAVEEAANGSGFLENQAKEALLRVCSKKFDDTPISYNDHNSRTKKEVLALFTSAIRSENARP